MKGSESRLDSSPIVEELIWVAAPPKDVLHSPPLLVFFTNKRADREVSGFDGTSGLEFNSMRYSHVGRIDGRLVGEEHQQGRRASDRLNTSSKKGSGRRFPFSPSSNKGSGRRSPFHIIDEGQRT